MANLVIKEEKYEIQVGREVYSVRYPSFAEAQSYAKIFKDLENSEEEAGEKMIQILKDLGLNEKFFSLEVITARHIVTIWQEINGVKK